MAKLSIKKQIAHHLDEATRLAENEIERMARDILHKHPHLDAFIMAMGDATFTVKGSDDNLDLEDRSYFKPLRDLIEEFNPYLGLMGIPMWFTADGPKITEW